MSYRLELTLYHALDTISKNNNMNKISEYIDKTITKTYSFYNGYGFKKEK